MAQSAEQKVEALARAAAERAAVLALAGAQKAQDAAVERAVRDARVDHDLSDHQSHLDHINGSQLKMAEALEALQTSFSELSISNRAVADYVGKQADNQFSRRTLWIAAFAGTAGWVAMMVTLVTTVS